MPPVLCSSLRSVVFGLWSPSPALPQHVGNRNGGRERGRPRPHQPDDRSHTRFIHANPTPEHSPVGCGEESPRSRNALGKPKAVRSAAVPGRINPTPDLTPVSFTQIWRPTVHRLGAGKNARAPAARRKPQRRRERGRPRPHQPDDRSHTRFIHANPAPEHRPAGCGEESPRSRSTSETATAVGSAAVPGRINPTTDRTTRFIHANLAPDRSPAGGGQECPRSSNAFEKAMASGARPSPAASTRRPISHPFRSRKPDARTFTGWVRRRIAALPQHVGNRNGGRERGRPRPHQPDTRSYTRFVHANPTPERSPAECGQECPRSRQNSFPPPRFTCIHPKPAQFYGA